MTSSLDKSKPKKGAGAFRKISAIYISLLLLVVIVVFFFFGNRSFFSVYNLGVIGNAAAILLTVGLGQMFVIMTGGIDLSVGGVISIVSVVYLLGLNSFGHFSFLIAIVVGCAAGLLNGIIFLKAKIPSFVVTLGTGSILVSMAYMLHISDISVSPRNFSLLDLVNGHLLGVSNGWAIALVVTLGYFIIQKYTYLGRAIISIGSNERMSWMSGINVARSKLAVFLLSSFAASVGGILLAGNLYSGSAVFGDPYVLESIAVVVVGGTAITGGTGGVLNTVVGALIMSVFQNGMIIVGVDLYAQQTILGILIIAAVFVTFDRSKVITIK